MWLGKKLQVILSAEQPLSSNGAGNIIVTPWVAVACEDLVLHDHFSRNATVNITQKT